MTSREPVFARDRATAEYYDQRAPEYDDWYDGGGLFARRNRPGWNEEVAQLVELVASLAPARTLDVACGTGYLTRHLEGFVVGVDRSPTMASLTAARTSSRRVLVGDALQIGLAPASFDRVFTAHFYGHLPEPERGRFLHEAGRLGRELIVVDSALRPGVVPEQWQERVLNDGSSHQVFKRYLDPGQLAEEIGGDVLMAGSWFVAARARLG